MLIRSGTIFEDALAGRVAIVTGAGGGIGLEAARSLLGLGACVIIAEIDEPKGNQAEVALSAEFGPGRVWFVPTDIGDESSVARLADEAHRFAGQVDIVINNATLAPVGAVHETAIEAWDRSYRVNLRGPVLLARAFLPEMIVRRSGVFVCVSSVGTAYMGPYETFKAAQVHLANTLADELEGTGVCAFTIGPGFVPTDTAMAALPFLAKRLGVSLDELLQTLKSQTVSVEAAGAGFAAAVALAERYHGQEIGSIQALIDAGITIDGEPTLSNQIAEHDLAAVAEQAGRVRRTLQQQVDGWADRPFFERQWLVRTFKKQAGKPVEGWLADLEALESAAAVGDGASVNAGRLPLTKLKAYYDHLVKAAEGYVSDPAEREQQVAIVRGWQHEVEKLAKLVDSPN